MQDFAHQVGLLAQSERTTVLLNGESGTGKGWVARMIHDLSPRAKAPFVEVNCAGLNATFLDSELFGHEKGAFTDAKDRKQGLFEIADHGTIFLDEIGDLAPELQPKLLKVLETKTFRRLGGTREITVDVRLIAATNKNLQAGGGEQAGSGRTSTTASVSCRSRCRRCATGRGRTGSRSSPGSSPISGPSCPTARPRSPSEVLERLLAYPWPGNVREMRNVLERALILGRSQPAVSVEHLPGEFRARPGMGDRRHTPLSLEDLERQHIERTLKHHTGNRTRAAIELGISRATLINKIKRYNIRPA